LKNRNKVFLFVALGDNFTGVSCYESKSPLRSDLNYAVGAIDYTWTRKGYKYKSKYN